MTTAKYRTTTLQGQTVHYIEADLAAIAVEDIGKSSVYNSGKFGYDFCAEQNDSA